MARTIVPADVLAFWFGAPGSPDHGRHQQRWFAKDPAFDAEIIRLFQADVEAAIAGAWPDWESSSDGALALVLMLDQFPRHIWRGMARAFAGDSRALRIARQAVAEGLDRDRPAVERVFLYLPFEHSERPEDQDRSCALFATCREHEEFARIMEYAERHRQIIRRFGRFPHRNAALGRPTTDEEATFLTEPNSSF